MVRLIAAQPKFLRQSEALLLLGIVGWMDLLTGYQVTLGLFYSIPILFAVRFSGDRTTPFLMAVLACAVWAWGDVANGHQYFSSVHQAWEISIRCGFFFLLALAGVALVDRDTAVAQRMASLEYATGLEKQLHEVSEYEQQRVGRELHDGLCQYLAAVSCATTALKMDLEGLGLPAYGQKAKDIEGLITRAVEQGRDLARSLSPVPNDIGGLPAALQELASAASRRFGIECTFSSTGEMPRTSGGKPTHLYRIAQEAVDNAATHGRAASVELRMSANPDAVSISITDNGIGIPDVSSASAGTGIALMQCRANAVGGELHIEPRSRGGTIVSCTVPAK